MKQGAEQKAQTSVMVEKRWGGSEGGVVKSEYFSVSISSMNNQIRLSLF
jgi:hypothetical protein